MADSSLASIIISNCNYAPFLKEAVDSALNQTYPHTEVIVVDDGSTDGSREIIAGYGDRIRPLLKPNGGHTSAMNAGYQISRGSAIFFLDSDDTMFTTTVERAMALLRDGGAAKVHWPMVEVNAESKPTGKIKCPNAAEGDLKDLVVSQGPLMYPSPPTSGNAWSRQFLEQVFPLPEVEAQFGFGGASADSYLSALAPLFGRITRITEPQCTYRVHAKNVYATRTFDDRMRHDLMTFDHCSAAMERYCRMLGIDVNPEQWKRKSWHHRVNQAAQNISARVPEGESFILVDEEQWETGGCMAGRKALPFLEHNGHYWGKPEDDEMAICEIGRMRRAGAALMAFAWPAFWWLDYYSRMCHYLSTEFRCVNRDDSLVLFDMRRNGVRA